MGPAAQRDGERALGDPEPMGRSWAWLHQQVLGSGYRAQPSMSIPHCPIAPVNPTIINVCAPRDFQRLHINTHDPKILGNPAARQPYNPGDPTITNMTPCSLSQATYTKYTSSWETLQ